MESTDPEQLANPISHAYCVHWRWPGLQDAWNGIQILLESLCSEPLNFNSTTSISPYHRVTSHKPRVQSLSSTIRIFRSLHSGSKIRRGSRFLGMSFYLPNFSILSQKSHVHVDDIKLYFQQKYRETDHNDIFLWKWFSSS